MKKSCILGSGSWAHALSTVFSNNDYIVKCRDINKASLTFKSKVQLVERFTLLNDSEYIFLAIPSQSLRKNLIDLKKETSFKKFVFVICNKGVEKKTNKLMSEVILDIFPNNKVVVLSGPNFSSELIAGKPSASVIASTDKKISKKVASLLSPNKFRIYFNNDIVGTQLGGAMKNVIAIACGLIKGKNLGENAKAAIITRGISEIVQLGMKMGAKRNTFYGLSGIGDLTLTCSSMKSRNTRFGFHIAKGRKLEDFKENYVLEGVDSCDSICNLGEKYNVELPLCNSIRKIINGMELEKVISNLLSRPLQNEN